MEEEGAGGILTVGILSKSKKSSPTHRAHQHALMLHFRAERRATVVRLLSQKILQKSTENTGGTVPRTPHLLPLCNNSSFAPKHLGFVVKMSFKKHGVILEGNMVP